MIGDRKESEKTFAQARNRAHKMHLQNPKKDKREIAEKHATDADKAAKVNDMRTLYNCTRKQS
ncbi:hypothetical protein CHS0354_008798 [Potamilus streckersoni]|uniref:Uncharacterized protein n=1 Tax=Potamilus streckersoni TaxID=2493646 RepID=A0AAE0SPS1_9BIVA|nr:hypothetical protein CHS0354_008798 [Potamilus streckersoni]